MQTCKVPESLYQHIDKVNCNFIWGHTEIKKKVHLVAWDKVCWPKDQGGLGIRSMAAVNIWANVFSSKYL